jgi:uncharacterized membrane protein
MADVNIFALRVANREAAHDLFARLAEVDHNDDSIRITDAACAYKTDNNTLKIEQTNDVNWPEGSIGGGLVGVVAGAIMMGPVGAVVGALTGGSLAAVITKLRDSGINNDDIRAIGDSLAPNQAALILQVEGNVNNRTLWLDTLSAFNAQMVTTTVPSTYVDDARDALRRADMTSTRLTDYELSMGAGAGLGAMSAGSAYDNTPVNSGSTLSGSGVVDPSLREQARRMDQAEAMSDERDYRADEEEVVIVAAPGITNGSAGVVGGVITNRRNENGEAIPETNVITPLDALTDEERARRERGEVL